MKKIITLMLVLALAGAMGTATVFAAPDEGGSTQGESQADKVLLKVNCLGEGQIAVSDDGSEPVFDDESPMQSAALNVSRGNTVKIKAKAAEGYTFKYWWDEDSENIYAAEDTLEVEMNVERDLYAIFEINAETVELRGGVKGEGMIEGTMDGSEPEFDDDYPMQSIVMNVIKGESAKLKAKPKKGYMFVCWIDGDTNDIIALEDTIDVKMDEPIYLVAVFDVAGERHRVNVGIGEGFGQLTYTEDGSEPEFGDDHFTSLALSVLEGRTVKLKAKADEGYRFVFWYDEDKKEIIGLEDTLSVEVAKEMNIGAYFDVDVDRIILEVNTEGQGQIAGDERDDDPQFDDDMPFQSLYLRVIPGNTVVLKAKADEGYKFVGWKNAADGKIVSTDATYGVEVNEDMKLTAIFEMIESSNSGNDNSGNSSSNNSNNGAGRATDGTNGSTNTPATGDATSAAALVAITLGSLGTTVMLGKKHRKDEE